MWFKSSKPNNDLIHLLKQSSSDFGFDPARVKYRLLTSISQADQKPAHQFRFGRVVRYSASFVAVVVMISTTFAFASNAKPGEKLFALNKFGENVVLSLPLSVEQKAKVQEYIVTNRLDALDKVNTRTESTKLGFEEVDLETIRESDESLMSAVDAITTNKKQLEASGKTEAAGKLEKVLDQLQSKAQTHEAAIKAIEERTKNADTKAAIRQHLQKMENSKLKARSQIKRFNTDHTDNSEDKSND